MFCASIELIPDELCERDIIGCILPVEIEWHDWQKVFSIADEYVIMRADMPILRTLLILLASLLATSCGASRFEVLGNVDNPYALGAIQVSDDGNTVLSPIAGHGTTEAFIWRSGAVGQTFSRYSNFTPLGISGDGKVLVGADYLAGTRDVATSFDGSVVVGRRSTKGYWRVAGELLTEFTYRTNEGFEVVPYSLSSDGNTVVGAVSGPNHNEPFRWTASEGLVTIGMLPGVSTSRGGATDVSADGKVVVGLVGSRHEFGLNEAFVWTPADGLHSLHPAGTLGETSASAVSADGKTIVGRSFMRNRSDQAVLWDGNYNMRAIATILSEDFSVDLRGVELRNATGVSADGRIVVGWGIGSNRTAFAWRADLSPIPEASSFMMAVFAAICGMLSHRMR